MFDRSDANPIIPSFLRWVLAVECSVVFAAGVLLFFLPGLAADLWPWAIPPFNARFVGAVYLAAYVPLILFWFVPRWIPGRLRDWCYRFALERGYFDSFLDEFVVTPFWRVFQWCDAAERRWTDLLSAGHSRASDAVELHSEIVEELRL